jgi:hypothetical protein
MCAVPPSLRAESAHWIRKPHEASGKSDPPQHLPSRVASSPSASASVAASRPISQAGHPAAPSPPGARIAVVVVTLGFGFGAVALGRVSGHALPRPAAPCTRRCTRRTRLEAMRSGERPRTECWEASIHHSRREWWVPARQISSRWWCAFMVSSYCSYEVVIHRGSFLHVANVCHSWRHIENFRHPRRWLQGAGWFAQ